MNNWVKSILIGLVIVAVYFFYTRSYGNKGQLYRIHYVVKVSKEAGSSATMDETINQVQAVLDRRLITTGYTPATHRADVDEIDMVIKHVDDTLLARQIVETNNKLEIREVYTLEQLIQPFTSIMEKTERFFPKDPEMSEGDSNKLSYKKNLGYLIGFSVGQDGRIVNSSSIGMILPKDTSLINKIFSDPEILVSFPADIVFRYGPAENSNKKAPNQHLLSLYAIRTKMQESELQNKHIEYADVVYGFNKQPEIRFSFNATGSRIWERMTRENIGRYLAIIIDHNVISAPRVNDAVTGGYSTISGGFTIKEAELLARQLNSGSMPADLRVRKQEVTKEDPAFNLKSLAIAGIIFLASAALAFLIFYLVKRK